MKKLIPSTPLILAVLLFTNTSYAQGVAVNTTGSPADTSAIMDVSSTTQGMLVPRMLSGERTSISAPANGLLVYQTDAPAGFYFYNAGTWQPLSTPANATTQGNTFNGANQLVQLNGSAQLPAVDGSQLTNLPSSAASAGTLTGGTLASGVTSSSLTSVGTLTGLTVSTPINGSVTGNAGTATKLATPRNINGVAFDGTADITAPAAANTLTGGTLASGVTSSSLTSVGTLTGLTVSTPINGSVTGNAGAATKLATARNINGVAFDGTADITAPAAAGTLTGGTLASGVTTSSLTSVGTLANLTVTNPISGSLTGNAGTATKLATARTINGTSFDGSANVTITEAASTLTGSTLASGVTASSLTSVGTLTGLTVSAAITGSVTGNAGTATKLATARTINGTSFDGSANITITDGSALTNLGAAHISGVIPAANLGTSSGSAATFLNGAGAFSTPTPGAGIPRVTYLIVPTSGAINYTVSDLTKSVFVFYFNGTAGPTTTSTITLAPANSYPAGSLISFYEMSYNPAPSSNVLNITSTSSSTQVIYSSFNANAVDIRSGHSLTTAFNTNGACIKFMSDGVSSWYRFLQ